MTNKDQRLREQVTAFGESRTVQAWAMDERCIVPFFVLHGRIKAGVKPEEAMTRPSRGRSLAVWPEDCTYPHAVMHGSGKCPYRGVNWNGERWEAEINANGIRKRLGKYLTPEDAARAYDEAAIKYHGPDAVLNRVDELGGVT